MLRESKQAQAPSAGTGYDTDDIILPTWKWDGGGIKHDPWYGDKPAIPRKRLNARTGLAALNVCDLLLIALLLLLLLVLKEQDHRGCNLRLADMAWFRRALLRCQASILDLKKQARGPSWASWSKCNASATDLTLYFNHTARAPCPDTPRLAETLRFRDSCHELPRRSCRSAPPPEFVEPAPYPAARWHVPDDRNVLWGDHRCQGYSCLVANGPAECPHCFNLTEEHGTRWAADHQMGIEEVLALKAPGHLRIGLDVAGGAGRFAAKMADRGVLIVTLSANSGVPFMETLASRGLPALHLPLDVRLPFFDGTLDLVHYSHSTPQMDLELADLELVLFEWDRVLRPGGLIWLDSVQKQRGEIQEMIELVDLLGYKKRLWKLDHVQMKRQKKTLFSTVLEKPSRREKKTSKPLATMT